MNRTVLLFIAALFSLPALVACGDVDWGTIQEVWGPDASDAECSNEDYQVIVIKQPDGSISHTCVTPSEAKRQVVGSEFKPSGIG